MDFEDEDDRMDGVIMGGGFSILGPQLPPPPPPPPPKKFSCKSCCFSFCRGLQSFVTFVVSRVGLVALVVGYCLIGAVTFERLERLNELRVKDGISDIRAEVAEDIWRLTNEAEVLKAEDWMSAVNRRMKRFEHELIGAMRVDGWNGFESHDKTQWTFTGSLFYSIVCITTIGYGDQTPKTVPGKIVTILYAILGMPLMLFCLSSTGHAMAQSFRFLYWRVCCFLCLSSRAAQANSARKRQQQMLRDRHARSINRNMSVRSSLSGLRTPRPSGGGRHTPRPGSWVYSDFQTPTDEQARPIPQILAPEEDTGSGNDEPDGIVIDKQPSSTKKQTSLEEPPPIESCIKREDDSRDSKKSQKSVKSLSLNLPTHQHRSGSVNSSDSSPNSNSNVRPNKLSPGSGGGGGGSFRSATFDEYAESMMPPPSLPDTTEDVRKRDIPLWICGVLVIGYIVGGAFLFTSWEKWTFLDSAYFCFITLTTIGFGDFVPKAEEKDDTELSIILCSVYLLFGMSLLVMTFNLVQQRVVDQVRGMAQKLGIIRDESFEYD